MWPADDDLAVDYSMICTLIWLTLTCRRYPTCRRFTWTTAILAAYLILQFVSSSGAYLSMAAAFQTLMGLAVATSCSTWQLLTTAYQTWHLYKVRPTGASVIQDLVVISPRPSTCTCAPAAVAFLTKRVHYAASGSRSDMVLSREELATLLHFCKGIFSKV
jgi:hypothetical protein